MSKNNTHMVRGRSCDEIGRLDHMKESDSRAKSRRDWESEWQKEIDDIHQEWKDILSDYMFSEEIAI